MKETIIAEVCHMFLHGNNSVKATCGHAGVLGRTHTVPSFFLIWGLLYEMMSHLPAWCSKGQNSGKKLQAVNGTKSGPQRQGKKYVMPCPGKIRAEDLPSHV